MKGLKIMGKLHYYENQSYLIKREQRTPNYVPDKAAVTDVSDAANYFIDNCNVIDVSDIANFKIMINDIRPYEVFYRVYFFTDKLVSDIAYAIACDCEVTLAVDSLNLIATFEVFDELEPAAYKTYPQAKKDALFAYVNEQLKNSGIPAENEYYKMFKEKCDALTLEPRGFVLTEEIKTFITIWAPAYGIPTPRFETVINSNERDLPRHWLTNIPELKEKCSDFKKSMSKWDCSGMKTLQADTLKHIKAVLDSLQFYRRNNIPLNDDWRICKHCGLPYSTTLIPDGAVYINQCQHCETKYKPCTVEYCSEQTTHIPVRGHKVNTTSKD